MRQLTAEGVVQVVASFPLRKRRDVPGPPGSAGGVSSYDQQEIAFAVSPDGHQVAAAIYTLPNAILHPACPADRGPGCTSFTPGTVHVDVYRAWAGGRSWLVHSEDVPNQAYDWASRYPVLVGWDARGPLGVLGRVMGAQAAGRWAYNRLGGYPVHLDPLGRSGPRLGGSDCLAWADLDDQGLLCQPGGYQRAAVSVRGPDGSPTWNVRVPASVSFIDSLAISPDAARVAIGAFLDTTVVVDRSGRAVTLPTNFSPLVWIDAQTIVGESISPRSPAFSAALVNLAALGQLQALNVPGRVVGSIAAP